MPGGSGKFKKLSIIKMVQIIPAILEKSFKEVALKIKRIEQEAPEIKWVQLDIADGKFVPNTTWLNPSDLSKLKTELNLEIHLMIKEPMVTLSDWLDHKIVKRLIIHQETIKNDLELVKIIKLIKERGREAGVALNPGTPISSIQNFLNTLNEVLLMSVEPGFSGQVFKQEIFDKIRALRKLNPKIPIAVDGGINLGAAPALIAAGANRLCVASYLWHSKDLKKAVKALKANNFML
jgi:ribulose-phosphate 3-epimerase